MAPWGRDPPASSTQLYRLRLATWNPALICVSGESSWMGRCSKASQTTVLQIVVIATICSTVVWDAFAITTKSFCHQKPRSILLEWEVNTLTRSALSSSCAVLAFFSPLWQARWFKYCALPCLKTNKKTQISIVSDCRHLLLISTLRRRQEL